MPSRARTPAPSAVRARGHFPNEQAALRCLYPVNPAAITVTERKASLFIDVAQAFLQWGKYGQAYTALRATDAHVVRSEADGGCGVVTGRLSPMAA